MKISVKSADMKHRLTLFVPLRLVGVKWIWRVAERSVDEKDREKFRTVLPSTGREIYRALRKYVKANGHFVLVEVNSHDGDRVLIVV